MSPLLLHVLRRLTLLSIILVVALAVGPPILRELELWGPTVEEEIEIAGRALRAAEQYGATEALTSYASAQRELAAAREAIGRGQRRRARRAADRARDRAIEAQRSALVYGEQSRQRAEAVVEETDERMNRLDDLFERALATANDEARSQLLSRMKLARQAGAGLFLAHEQGNYAKVIEDEPAATRVLEQLGRDLARTARERPVLAEP